MEIDKSLEYALRNKSFLKLWAPKLAKYLNRYTLATFEDEFLNVKYYGAMLEKINIIPSTNKFDLIYLDGFSPKNV